MLTGCGTVTRTVWFDPDVLYPKEITQCKDAPPVPPRPEPQPGDTEPRPREDVSKAEFDRDLYAAWADCYDNTTVIRERKKNYKIEYDKAHSNPLERTARKITGKDRKAE